LKYKNRLEEIIILSQLNLG